MALISHSHGLITDEELLLLLDINTARNPEFSYDIYDRFDLDEIDQAECKSEFRIEKRDIPLFNSRCSWSTTDLQMPTENCCGRYRRPMYAFKTNEFPLPL